jgi:tRNA nucleotidyltransferase (CCA-adding enzyme)
MENKLTKKIIDEDLKFKVLSEIVPDQEKCIILDQLVKKVIRKLKRISKNEGILCDFFVGGSYGKGTFLNGKFDIDIFVRFDLSYPDSKLSELLFLILNKANFKVNKLKGSRDYYSLTKLFKKVKVDFEFIPIYNISNISDAKNSTDISPFHIEFMKEQISKKPQIVNEIRLAKQFFKANNLYGAESYIGGFSGHSIEILVSYYGSFENFLLNARDWKDEVVIDICNYYSSLDEIKKEIGLEKLSNLIIIDPILKNRNASRALSSEIFYKFLFLVNIKDKLEYDDFIIKEIDLKEEFEKTLSFAKDNNLKGICYKFNFNLNKSSEDIVGSKLKKLFQRLENFFIDFDFLIFKSKFLIDMKKKEVVFIYLFENVKLPKVKVIKGPKVFMDKESIKRFIEKSENYFINKDGRISRYENRRVLDIDDIYRLDLSELEKILNKKLDFIKKYKITKF